MSDFVTTEAEKIAIVRAYLKHYNQWQGSHGAFKKIIDDTYRELPPDKRKVIYNRVKQFANRYGITSLAKLETFVQNRNPASRAQP